MEELLQIKYFKSFNRVKCKYVELKWILHDRKKKRKEKIHIDPLTCCVRGNLWPTGNQLTFFTKLCLFETSCPDWWEKQQGKLGQGPTELQISLLSLSTLYAHFPAYFPYVLSYPRDQCQLGTRSTDKLSSEPTVLQKQCTAGKEYTQMNSMS